MNQQALVKEYVKIVSQKFFESTPSYIKEQLGISEEEARQLCESEEIKEIGALKRKFDDKKRENAETDRWKLLFDDFEEFYHWIKS